ncbi:Uncharacterized protein FKW44_022396, partial [Caligus rogercresseyi]
TRDQAKILNYGRIYGAGLKFAKMLLKKFNPSLDNTQAPPPLKKCMMRPKGNGCTPSTSWGLLFFVRLEVRPVRQRMNALDEELRKARLG